MRVRSTNQRGPRRCLGVLGFAAVLLTSCYLGGAGVHYRFTVRGVVHIVPPGPASSPAPAVVCLSANGYQMLVGYPIGSSDLDVQEPRADGFVLCQVPDDGIDVPFTTSHYTTKEGSESTLLAAYLVSTAAPVPECNDGRVSTRVEASVVAGLCGEPPPKSEIALALPAYDDGGRPTPTISILVDRGQH